MIVKPTDMRWARALDRAASEELQVVSYRMPLELAKGGFTLYLVECSRKDGSWYQVQVHEGTRENHVICSCKAGQNRTPCKHGAAALFNAGLYTHHLRKEEAA